MKRERLSFFVLLLEIAAITMLHSAKNNQPGVDRQQVAKGKSTTTTVAYQLKANLPFTTLK